MKFLNLSIITLFFTQIQASPLLALRAAARTQAVRKIQSTALHTSLKNHNMSKFNMNLESIDKGLGKMNDAFRKYPINMLAFCAGAAYGIYDVVKRRSIREKERTDKESAKATTQK